MGSAGVGWRNGEKRHTTVIEYNKNFFKKRKEQIKTPEKELSNEEIDNLSDAEFETLVSRISTHNVSVGRKASLPHTTKRRITTNLKTKNNQNCQKNICMEVQQPRS